MLTTNYPIGYPSFQQIPELLVIEPIEEALGVHPEHSMDEASAATYQSANKRRHFARKLAGHFNYYGMQGNSQALNRFAYEEPRLSLVPAKPA